MKKFLLSIAALAMSFAASAQVDVQHQRVGVVEQSPYFAQQSAVVHKAAKRIAANQRWVGYYSSDALAAAHRAWVFIISQETTRLQSVCLKLF